VIGALLGSIASAGSRVAVWAGLGALWLISRPGGWAVLVLLVLLALRWFPERPPGS
jgi:hypothetical protein